MKASEYADRVTMRKPMEFDVKINSKIKESQDNANRISSFKKKQITLFGWPVEPVESVIKRKKHNLVILTGNRATGSTNEYFNNI